MNNLIDKNLLMNLINQMRKKMISIGIDQGLTSENTVEVSQYLDELINLYQKHFME